MGIGVGLVLMAIGAVLTFAVHLYTNAANIQVIGVILTIVGAIGLLLDLMLFSPRRRANDGYAAETVVTRRRVG